MSLSILPGAARYVCRRNAEVTGGKAQAATGGSAGAG